MSLLPCLVNPVYENGLLSSISVSLRPSDKPMPNLTTTPPFAVTVSFMDNTDTRHELSLNNGVTLHVENANTYTITLGASRRRAATVAKHGVDVLVTYNNPDKSDNNSADDNTVINYSVILIKNPINETATVVSADGRLVSKNDNQQITLPIVHLSRQPVRDDFKDFDNCLCFIDEFPYMNVSPVPVFLRRQTQFTWNIYVDTANTWIIAEKPDWLTLTVDDAPAITGTGYSYDKVVWMSVQDIPDPGMYNDYVLIRNLTTGKDVYVPVLLDVDVPLTVNEQFDMVDLGTVTQADIGADGASFELRIRRDRYWKIIGLDALEGVFTLGREDGYHSAITKITLNPSYNKQGINSYSFYVVSDTYSVLVKVAVYLDSSIAAFPTGIIWLNQKDTISAGAGVASLEFYGSSGHLYGTATNGTGTKFTGNIRNNNTWLCHQSSITKDSIFTNVANVATKGDNANNLNRISAWTQRVVFCTRNYNWNGVLPMYNGETWEHNCFTVQNITNLTQADIDKLGYNANVSPSPNADGSYNVSGVLGGKIWVFDVTFDPNKVDGFFSSADDPRRVAGISRGCTTQSGSIWADNSKNDKSLTLDFYFGTADNTPMKFSIYVGYYIPSWYKVSGYEEIPANPPWLGDVSKWQSVFDAYQAVKQPYSKEYRELTPSFTDTQSEQGVLNLYALVGEERNYSSKVELWSNSQNDNSGNHLEIPLTYSKNTNDVALCINETRSFDSRNSGSGVSSGGRSRSRYNGKIPVAQPGQPYTQYAISMNSWLCGIAMNMESIIIPGMSGIPAKYHRQHFLRGWSVNLLPDAYYVKHAKIHVNTWGALASNAVVQGIDSGANNTMQKLLTSEFDLVYSDPGKLGFGAPAVDPAGDSDIIFTHYRMTGTNRPKDIEAFRLRDSLLGKSCNDSSYDKTDNEYRYLFDRHNGHENTIKEQDYFAPGMFRVYKQTLTSTIPAGVNDFIGERTLTLEKYIYVRGYDEDNLLLPNEPDTYDVSAGANPIVSTYNFSLASKNTWETIVRDMKHPLWTRTSVRNTALLNVKNYNNRNDGLYVTYKFKKPVTLRGLMSLLYVQTRGADRPNDSELEPVATWFVEGRINGHLDENIPKTDWFPITQFSHCPYNSNDDLVMPYVVNRPFTFPPVLVDEVRVFGCSPTRPYNNQTTNVSVQLPVIYWFEYCPLLNPYMGTARENHDDYVTDYVSNESMLGILDGYGSGMNTQPHQMAVIVSNTSRFDERRSWGDIVDGFIENAPTNNKALQTTAADDYNLGFTYPLLSTQIIDLSEWRDALDNNEDYLANFNVTDVQPPIAGDIRVKLVPFRNYSSSYEWVAPVDEESILSTTHRNSRSPYPFFEEIEMKGIMYMPMIRKEHGFSLAYLKISPYAHRDSNYALSQDGYRFFIALCGTNDNFADFRQNPYRSASGGVGTYWHRRMSASTSNDTIGYIGDNDSYPGANNRWSCITCGNVLGEFSLNEMTQSGAITVSQLFGAGNENADKQESRLLDDYVEHIKSALTLIDGRHVTIYMRSGSLDWRFLFRRNTNGKWTNYGRTAVIADQNSLTIADNLMAEVNVRPSGITASGGIGFDGRSAYDIWVRERGNTTPSQLFTYHEQFGDLFLWAYQRAYSNAESTRFIITDTTTMPWTVKRVEDFTWEFLDSYHRTIDRDKSKGLFFVLSGRALNNMYSRSTNRYTFGEFQMFHKKPPCGDFYPVTCSSPSYSQYIINGKNSDNADSEKLYDTLETVTTNDIYASRNSWTGYALPPWVEDSANLATMYPVATVFFGTSTLAAQWSNTTLYSSLKDRTGAVLGGVGGSSSANGFTHRVHDSSFTYQSTAFLEFSQEPHNNAYPDTLATVASNASAEVKKWLPCRGWEYPFFTNITLYTYS